MGSCVYIGYRAKKKADEIQQAYKSNDLNKLAGALGVGIFEDGLPGIRRKRRLLQFGAAFFSGLDAFLRRLNPEAKFLCVPDSRW